MSIKGLLVEHHNVRGIEVVIPTPEHLLPLYDHGTTIIFYVDRGEMEGEVVGINVQSAMDPKTREIDTTIVYSVMVEGFDSPLEVLEDEVTAQYEDTNSLTSNYYDEEEDEL